ncbi:tRNA(Ile)-lysidine synthase [Metalysinibacillus saudimassiliensis]|uniref:tRNA(Ile)-lysidine synthase n=1 Tax=Metalysinibacillus saudimassiliensis TaxID=1461583 RepID=A0A078M4J0_9BACL|nr:tRNA(Ile)-lysidine synthase [Metalysinibacillus saudimassiliensis]
MKQRIIQQIKAQSLIEADDRLVLAVSGGVDSMVMLDCLRNFPCESLIVAHVDHMLRAEESAGDAALVEAYCKQHQLPFVMKAINIPHILATKGGNTQVVCRQQRYQFLREVANEQRATKIVTAHHADDQLESLIMALAQDATTHSMQGIKVKREIKGMTIIRPLLTFSKEVLYTYAEVEGVPFREDASNASTHYLRNRIRHQVVPLLQRENPKITQNITRFTTQLAEDEVYLQQQATQLFEEIVLRQDAKSFCIEILEFKKKPVALQRRVVLLLLSYLYEHHLVANSQALVADLLQLMDTETGNKQCNLPRGFIAYRAYHMLYIQQQNPKNYEKNKKLQFNEWFYCENGVRLCVTMPRDISYEAKRYYFNSQKLQLPFLIRQRLQGDRMILQGMKGSKRLSRLFIDCKVPAHERDNVPILLSGDEVIGACGVRMSYHFSEQRRSTDDMMLCVISKEVEASEKFEEESLMIQNDIEKVIISEEQLDERVRELGAELTEEYRGTYPLAIGVLKGAMPFMTDLMKRFDTYVELDFMDVTSYGNATVSSGEVKILKDLNTSVEGRDILIIEDIIDSGLTLSYLVDLFKYRKAKSIKIVTLLDKPSGRKVDLKADIVGFEVPDGFVVGYGLDYAEKYRNLPYIGILKREVYSF